MIQMVLAQNWFELFEYSRYCFGHIIFFHISDKILSVAQLKYINSSIAIYLENMCITIISELILFHLILFHNYL